MKYFSLFTGIGGFERGIEQAYGNKDSGKETKDVRQFVSPLRHHGDSGDTIGSDGNGRGIRPICVGFSEINKYASEIYQSHYSEHKNYGDITTINAKELPDFELLVGGFPCQSFSIAGKRGGFDDTRGTLFFDIARIIKEKRPRLLFLENVKGLLSHDNGNTFKTIITTLDELGYDLQWQVLNSKDFGVPQNRERVYIIGHLRGTPRPEIFPIGSGNQGSDTKQLSRPQASGQDQDLRNIESWWRPEMRIRKLTPIECERLQGFPDNWTAGVSDTQRYKCCGNAVTVNTIEAIANRLI